MEISGFKNERLEGIIEEIEEEDKIGLAVNGYGQIDKRQEERHPLPWHTRMPARDQREVAVEIGKEKFIYSTSPRKTIGQGGRHIRKCQGRVKVVAIQSLPQEANLSEAYGLIAYKRSSGKEEWWYDLTTSRGYQGLDYLLVVAHFVK
jgi:hypothetical protein